MQPSIQDLGFCYAQENRKKIEELRKNPTLDLIEKMNNQMAILENRIKRLEEVQCQEQ